VAFCIGGYPPEEFKRRADLALSYANAEIQVGIINVEASPYFYGITPTEIQLVAPAFIGARYSGIRMLICRSASLAIVDISFSSLELGS